MELDKVLTGAYKSIFWKNIDTFINYVNYLIIYTLPYCNHIIYLIFLKGGGHEISQSLLKLWCKLQGM